nr:hairy:enhancer of split related with YRPW [Hymenolepis microstoma]
MHCPSPDDYIEEDDNFSCENSTEMERKRRRGIIEKKRRDRINYLLSELRRIIPLGAQKQTSTKLEKAEILEATVEFNRRILSDGTALNAEMRVLEDRMTGFRECFTELTRYLSAKPVMSSEDDDLRRKLLTHLHQRILKMHYDAQERLASISLISSRLNTDGNAAPHQPSTSHQSYWNSQPIKKEEYQWKQSDYSPQNSFQHHHQQQQPTPEINESQSTTSPPSMLETLEENDSVGRAASNHMFQPISNSNINFQSYTYDPSLNSTGGYESFAYGYQQNYPETARFTPYSSDHQFEY